MNAELKKKILAYNKKVRKNKEKADDMDALAAAIMTLPPGQLKKLLEYEAVADLLAKYGVEV